MPTKKKKTGSGNSKGAGVAAKVSKRSKKNPAQTFSAFEFKGSWNGYFGIWIVNLVLTILTIGIYSAWAKVRRINYFYNNTNLAGNGLGYHATGWQIFKARVVVILVIIALNLISLLPVSPTTILTLTLLIWLAIILILPWAFNISLNFTARNTSWRNVRLRWHGTYGRSFVVFYVTPLLSIISLGLLAPLMTRIYYNYYAEGHSFGTTRFSGDLEVGRAYRAFFLSLVSAIVVSIGILAAVVACLYLIFSLDGLTATVFLVPYTLFLFFFIFNSVYFALCRNALLHTLRLGKVVQFESSINPVRYIWIITSNFLVIIVSLGLMIPWATVRKYRYLCSVTQYKVVGNINSFVDRETDKQNALGEEFLEMEGLEFGI